MNDSEVAIESSDGETVDSGAVGEVADSAGAAMKAPTRRLDDCDWCTATGDGRRGAE